jgi:dihydroorotate dehydrogenase
MDAEGAYAKVRAGATLVQVYTGLIYGGPGLVGRIHDGLSRLLARDGFASLAEAVGADHRAGGRSVAPPQGGRATSQGTFQTGRS